MAAYLELKFIHYYLIDKQIESKGGYSGLIYSPLSPEERSAIIKRVPADHEDLGAYITGVQYWVITSHDKQRDWYWGCLWLGMDPDIVREKVEIFLNYIDKQSRETDMDKFYAQVNFWESHPQFAPEIYRKSRSEMNLQLPLDLQFGPKTIHPEPPPPPLTPDLDNATLEVWGEFYKYPGSSRDLITVLKRFIAPIDPGSEELIISSFLDTIREFDIDHWEMGLSLLRIHNLYEVRHLGRSWEMPMLEHHVRFYLENIFDQIRKEMEIVEDWGLKYAFKHEILF